MSTISLFIYYWCEKYSFSKVYTRPAYINKNLSQEITGFYIESLICLFALGCWIFENLLFIKK